MPTPAPMPALASVDKLGGLGGADGGGVASALVRCTVDDMLVVANFVRSDCAHITEMGQS